ncbi:MAG: hypothetical protein A2189_02645 [Paenibacillus sp. RIFOXYA1_FULL_44_5]|nr:MAG: hypothetical protein A2189_02645 [Paenibacillus sp. RIFOXYA1_FULL_44_5]
MTEQEKKQKKEESETSRVVFTILRPLFILILCAVAAVVGVFIGYAGIGHEPASDVFKSHTWLHLFELVFG